MITKTD